MVKHHTWIIRVTRLDGTVSYVDHLCRSTTTVTEDACRFRRKKDAQAIAENFTAGEIEVVKWAC